MRERKKIHVYKTGISRQVFFSVIVISLIQSFISWFIQIYICLLNYLYIWSSLFQWFYLLTLSYIRYSFCLFVNNLFGVFLYFWCSWLPIHFVTCIHQFAFVWFFFVCVFKKKQSVDYHFVHSLTCSALSLIYWWSITLFTNLLVLSSFLFLVFFCLCLLLLSSSFYGGSTSMLSGGNVT